MDRLFRMTVIAALLLPAPALAQTVEPAPPASERRLSPEQIEAVLAEAARKREANQAQALSEGVDSAVPPRPQGEVGVSVGTGGYREVYGSALYPIGDDGAAAISFDFLNLGKRRDRR